MSFARSTGRHGHQHRAGGNDDLSDAYQPAVDPPDPLDNQTGLATDLVIEDFDHAVSSAGVAPAAHRDETRAALGAIKRDLADLADAYNALLAAIEGT